LNNTPITIKKLTGRSLPAFLIPSDIPSFSVHPSWPGGSCDKHTSKQQVSFLPLGHWGIGYAQTVQYIDTITLQ